MRTGPTAREVDQYLHYFCGVAADPNALNETETLRISFYKAVAVYVRAFAAMARDLMEAGYSDPEAAAIQKEVEFYGGRAPQVGAGNRPGDARAGTGGM